MLAWRSGRFDFRKKALSSVTTVCSTVAFAFGIGDIRPVSMVAEASAAKVLIVVVRVISFRSLSSKIGRHEDSSAASASAKWQSTRPMHEIAHSLTS